MTLNHYFADLHIHIGRDQFNKPIKITGSKNLTLLGIIKEARERKGLDMIGIIDCHAPSIQDELKQHIKNKRAFEKEGGGIQFGDLTLILGTELEIYDSNCNGPIHVLCYFPTLEKIKQFTEWLSPFVTNITLSSQRVYLSAQTFQKGVKAHSGLFVPAHVFTPFKSLYGKGVNKTLTEVFDPHLIDAIELGLSADSFMADRINELHRFTYLTNSDAHSLKKIAREYQIFKLKSNDFTELKLAFEKKHGRDISANYGMHPKLGKYYQSVCRNCLSQNFDNDRCCHCGQAKKIKGVSERIEEIANSITASTERPPYYYHVPLDYINGLGKKTYEKLLNHFGTEMCILHYIEEADLQKLVGPRITKQLMAIRAGETKILKGGGGKYGSLIE
ncbi:endonuclease Q family protein [Amphibacillus jilinensis]|uniref:endonuclease Q family protein n=1 Tax=Amphibacillus jilinensis TaxID=1216008 RepID=UPI00031FE477|nr:endonuclease Q family protein [Amphibacillus jilinensis]